MNTIKKIIKRLKKDGENGAYAVIETWEKDTKKTSKLYRKGTEDEYYNKVYGFLWGLYAAGYISREERKEAQEELIKEYNEKFNY